MGCFVQFRTEGSGRQINMRAAQRIARMAVRRLLFFAAAMVILSILVFLVLRVLPGDQASLIAGLNSTPEQVARLRRQLGLDRSYASQYFSWLQAVFHGDLGTSLLTGQSVAGQAVQRSQVTFPLICISLILSALIGIPLGVSSVASRRPAVQNIYRIAAICAAAIPALWLGLLLIMLFGRGTGVIGVLPVSGFPDDGWASPLEAVRSLILPAASVSVITGASVMRYTRSGLLDVARTDYISMSMAAGMTRREALWKTGLRLVVPQLASIFGITFAGMVTGVLVVEQLFALPGLSGMLMRDIQNRDLLAAQSEILLLSALFFAAGLVVDIMCIITDPRLDSAGSDAGTDGAGR